jgi:hypothetical protein
VYGKALIAGQTNDTGTVEVNGVTTAVVSGYLADSVDLTTLLDIGEDMEPIFVSGDGEAADEGQPGDKTSVIKFYGYDDSSFNYSSFDDSGCLILYTEAITPSDPATPATPATVKTSTGGCN